ncbi:MAG TPA: serine protease, partial [Thermopolyspora sp.]
MAAVSIAAVIAPHSCVEPSCPNVVQHTAAGGEQRRALDYWTPARMAAAVPIAPLAAAPLGL